MLDGCKFRPATRQRMHGRSGRLHSIGFGLIHAPSEQHPIAARPSHDSSLGRSLDSSLGRHSSLGRRLGFRSRIGCGVRLRFRNWSDQAVHTLQRERGSDVWIVAEDLSSGELMALAGPVRLVSCNW